MLYNQPQPELQSQKSINKVSQNMPGISVYKWELTGGVRQKHTEMPPPDYKYQPSRTNRNKNIPTRDKTQQQRKESSSSWIP